MNSEQSKPPKPIVIMLIDDNPEDLYINNWTIEKYCRRNSVLQFNMATDALKYLQENSNNIQRIPDVILLDLRMPIMSGFDFLEEYARLPVSLKLKCRVYILSTSFAPVDLEKLKNNVNVIAFFEKPLSRTIVEEILNKTEITL